MRLGKILEVPWPQLCAPKRVRPEEKGWLRGVYLAEGSFLLVCLCQGLPEHLSEATSTHALSSGTNAVALPPADVSLNLAREDSTIALLVRQ